MAKSATLRNRQGERIYPKTNASVTFMNNGVSVEAEILELKEQTKYYKGHFISEEALVARYPNDVSDEESISRTGWYAIVGETDTIWVWDVEGKRWLNSGSTANAPVDSVNGLIGDVVLTGSNVNATTTVGASSVTKPIASHLTDIYADIEGIESNSVTLDDDQIITGVKVFDEVIGLRNSSEGTVDQIKHINSNFLITSGTGENLLNIDEGLETISAFNRQLAFEDEIAQIQGDYATKQELNTAVQNVTDMIPTKVSELQNDNDYANKKYVLDNGGKINTISINGVNQTITNKNVNISVPTDVSELATTAQMSAINSGIDSSKVAKITSNENMLNSLAQQVVDDYVPKTRTINNKSLSNNITLNASDVNALPSDTTYVSSVNGNSGAITGLATTASINDVSSRVTTIENKIPSQASSTNQLADKDFVNSSINSVTAYYITKNAQGDPFATKAELTGATTYYSGGQVRTPTRNDYAIVISDETEDNGTTRYIYYNQWEFQYKINETPLTASQVQAINSGITSALVSKITTNETNINLLTEDLGYYVPITRTINGKALNSNISLSAGDVGALPSDTVIPTVNNGTLTIQKNGTQVGTFTANQSGNSTINIEVPTGTASTKGVDTTISSNPTDNNLPTSKAVKTYLSNNYLPLSGGTLTGSLTYGSIKLENDGTVESSYLRASSTQDLNSTATKFAVLDEFGNIYYRTSAEAKNDLGVPTGTASNYGVTTTVDSSNNLPTAKAVEEFIEGKGYVNPDDISSTYMKKANPIGTGALSMNRKASTTVGTNSTTVGYNNTASGSYSLAEGQENVASGWGSHAEGASTTSSGYYTHTEGYNTIARGEASHAEGQYTTATHQSQHVLGEYNVLDTSSATQNERGTYIEIVGNGTADNARANARTLDWSGNEVLGGNITATGFKTPSGTSSQVLRADGGVTSFGNVISKSVTTSITGSTNIPTDLAVKTYVTNAISSVITTALGGDY